MQVRTYREVTFTDAEYHTAAHAVAWSMDRGHTDPRILVEAVVECFPHLYRTERDLLDATLDLAAWSKRAVLFPMGVAKTVLGVFSRQEITDVGSLYGR